jgi:hypothetical protein
MKQMRERITSKKFDIQNNEQYGIAVTSQIYIPQVFVSNPDRNTGCPD